MALPISIQFEQTAELHYDFIKHYYTTNRTVRIGILILVVVILVSLMPVLTGSADSSDLLSLILPIIFILAIWVVLIPYFLKRRLRSSAAQQGGMTGHREMIFSEEDIVVKTNVSESSFAWDAILRASASKQTYYLFIAANQALIIPKDSFQSEADHDEFLELLMGKELWP